MIIRPPADGENPMTSPEEEDGIPGRDVYLHILGVGRIGKHYLLNIKWIMC